MVLDDLFSRSNAKKQAEQFLGKYSLGYNAPGFIHEAAKVIQNLLQELNEEEIQTRELHDMLAKMKEIYLKETTQDVE